MPPQFATAAALLFTCSFAGMGVPMPEELPLLAAGWAIHEGLLPWHLGLGTALLGLFIRDNIAWSLGAHLGTRLNKWGPYRRIVGPHRIERAEAFYSRHPTGALIATRFALGLRVPLLVVAGSHGVPWTRFALIDGLGLLLLVPIMVFIGWLLGPTATAVATVILDNTRIAIWVTLGAAALWWGLSTWRRRTASQDS